MADFPNSTPVPKIASSPRSRRAVLGGLAAALIGATVPAVASIPARASTGDDAELLSLCKEWHNCQRRIERMCKESEALANAGESRVRAYRRLDNQIERDATKNWRLFMRILGTKAETLEGAAAQFRIIEIEGIEYHFPKARAMIVRVMRNMRRLVAAQGSAGVRS